MKNLIRSFLVLLTIATITACTDNDDKQEGTASIAVRLTDKPGDYDKVNIEVTDVLIKRAKADGDESLNDEEFGWESIGTVNTGIYDLLELTGGIDTLLVSGDISAGKIEQIRLVLGDNNTVEKDGSVYDLKTPSAEQSGLKIKIDDIFEPGSTHNFLLDFDVSRSIIDAGNSGNLILKPVIRASDESNSGKIEGMVSPSTFQSIVTATNGEITVSAYVDKRGKFVLNGMPEGSYEITVTPATDSGYQEKTVENVEVLVRKSADLGIIELEELPVTG
ncbi:DUF4382 domain-containing protein [Spongiivirga citrea]|uniref:DUF4382 domain-containing protein n=1 Tax=Spongiivirga citrea TaxID=1481457 RepID=A0A6M0CML1_9FLAO|nr:DUF4382 domain-containing protein [Spongiivirga citrea]NER17254.1 DUF4382 domain-containing protein [Spongiivirga citrea]